MTTKERYDELIKELGTIVYVDYWAQRKTAKWDDDVMMIAWPDVEVICDRAEGVDGYFSQADDRGLCTYFRWHLMARLDAVKQELMYGRPYEYE